MRSSCTTTGVRFYRFLLHSILLTCYLIGAQLCFPKVSFLTSWPGCHAFVAIPPSPTHSRNPLCLTERFFDNGHPVPPPSLLCDSSSRIRRRQNQSRLKSSQSYDDDDNDDSQDDTNHLQETVHNPPQEQQEKGEFGSSTAGAGIRLNKVLKATHSRRQADALIASGRVSVNGQTVVEKGGFKVVPFVDNVALDGVVITGWEAMNGIVPLPQQQQQNDVANEKQSPRQQPQETTTETLKNSASSTMRTAGSTVDNNHNHFEYIKYWKPPGVTCTTDSSIPSNIIEDLVQRRGYQPRHRVYPVGRLDKDTSGLILLTSNGNLPNAALRGRFKQPKVYQVLVDQPLSDHGIQQLREGVVITTVAQRTGTNRGKALTAPTRPCRVDRIPRTSQRGVTMTLVEGRNRQIRKMMQALGYEVVELHRIQFMGITLGPQLQQAGEWVALNAEEMQRVEEVLQRAATEASTLVNPP